MEAAYAVLKGRPDECLGNVGAYQPSESTTLLSAPRRPSGGAKLDLTFECRRTEWPVKPHAAQLLQLFPRQLTVTARRRLEFRPSDSALKRPESPPAPA